MNGEKHFRPDVQALRGVAVLLVVAFHAWPNLLPGGFVGVDVFFVISGYLITGLLVREIDAAGRIDFAAFYARRIRRLLPAAALVIATTAAVAAWRYPPLEAREFSSTALAAALYVSNLLFAHLSVDYLAEGLHRNLLLHTWSLGVEEQFYLAWPALMAASMWLLRRVGARRAIAWMVGVVTLGSFLACLWLTPVLQSWAFFSLPTRAWELGAGAAAALLAGRAAALPEAIRRATALAGLISILVAGVLFSGQTRFPGYAALLPVAGAFLVIVGGAGRPAERPLALLRLQPLQRLGDVSYSWYLWHWPVLIVFADLWSGADRNWVALAGAAVSLGLARLTYDYVENPIRRHGFLQARHSRSFVMGLALALGTVVIAGGTRFASVGGVDSDPRRRIELAARDRPRLYDDKCFASALDSEPPHCVYGDPGGRRTVALVGDSHAAQWFPAVEALALAHGLRLVVFVKAACPLAMVEPVDPKLNRPYVECTRWREKVFERLASERPVLVIGANSGFYEPFVDRDRAAIEHWQLGLEQSLDRLGRIGDHVAVIRDTPRPGFHVPRCLARALAAGDRGPSTCTYALAGSVATLAVDSERAAVSGRPRAASIDLTDRICAGAVCPVERDGMVLFHDAEHLTATFARSLAEALWGQLPAAARAGLVE